MKKIFTLATTVLMAVAVMAADKRPSVTVQGTGYEVFIDGKRIALNQSNNSMFSKFGSTVLNNLGNGKHTITVYEIPRRFYASRNKRVVSTASFTIRGNDIAIKIDQDGKLKISETKNSKGFDYRDKDKDRGWDNDRDRGYGSGYGKDNGNQNGKGRDEKPKRF